MDPAVSLPVQLDVRGRRCVVVGGGVVGTRRVAALLDAGAQVRWSPPILRPRCAPWQRRAACELVERPFAPEDLDGARLVVAATGVLDVDEAVSTAAGASAECWSTAPTAPTVATCAFPAVVRRGPSAWRCRPAVPRRRSRGLVAESVDEGLDAVLGLDGDGLALLVDVVAEVRRLIEGAYGGPRPGGGADHEVGVTPGPLDWRSALDASILDLIRQGRRAEAKERLLACLSSS